MHYSINKRKTTEGDTVYEFALAGMDDTVVTRGFSLKEVQNAINAIVDLWIMKN